MNYTLIEGDLLDSDAKYIAHQCNCITHLASNLAHAVFERFPYANIYAKREGYDIKQLPLPGEESGNIVICGDGKEERYVINMLAQLYPGSPKYPDSVKDGFLARQRYFKDCLIKIIKIKDLESIAFPFRIGCGLAGGSWNIYEKLIDIFAKKAKADVFVYRLDP